MQSKRKSEERRAIVEMSKIPAMPSAKIGERCSARLRSIRAVDGSQDRLLLVKELASGYGVKSWRLVLKKELAEYFRPSTQLNKDLDREITKAVAMACGESPYPPSNQNSSRNSSRPPSVPPSAQPSRPGTSSHHNSREASRDSLRPGSRHQRLVSSSNRSRRGSETKPGSPDDHIAATEPELVEPVRSWGLSVDTHRFDYEGEVQKECLRSLTVSALDSLEKRYRAAHGRLTRSQFREALCASLLKPESREGGSTPDTTRSTRLSRKVSESKLGLLRLADVMFEASSMKHSQYTTWNELSDYLFFRDAGGVSLQSGGGSMTIYQSLEKKCTTSVPGIKAIDTLYTFYAKRGGESTAPLVPMVAIIPVECSRAIVCKVSQLEHALHHHVSLEGHTASVTAVCYSPVQHMLYTASRDCTIAQWVVSLHPSLSVVQTRRRGKSAEAQILLHVIEKVSEDPVDRRTTSTVVSAGLSGPITVWEVTATDLHPVAQLNGHTSAVLAACTITGMDRLATGDLDGTLKVWDMESGGYKCYLSAQFPGCRGITSIKYAEALQVAVCAGYHHDVIAWSPINGQLVFRMTGHECSLLGLHFNPSTLELMSVSVDGTMKVWDLQSSRCTFTAIGLLIPQPTQSNKPRAKGGHDTTSFCILHNLPGATGEPEAVNLFLGVGANISHFMSGSSSEIQRTSSDSRAVGIVYHERSATFCTVAGCNVYIWNAHDGKLCSMYRMAAPPVSGSEPEKFDALQNRTHHKHTRRKDKITPAEVPQNQPVILQEITSIGLTPCGRMLLIGFSTGAVQVIRYGGGVVTTLHSHEDAVLSCTKLCIPPGPHPLENGLLQKVPQGDAPHRAPVLTAGLDGGLRIQDVNECKEELHNCLCVGWHQIERERLREIQAFPLTQNLNANVMDSTRSAEINVNMPRGDSGEHEINFAARAREGEYEIQESTAGAAAGVRTGDSITCVTQSASLQFVATGAVNGSIIIWQVCKGLRLKGIDLLTPPPSMVSGADVSAYGVTDLCFLEPNPMLASIHEAGTLFLWSLNAKVWSCVYTSDAAVSFTCMKWVHTPQSNNNSTEGLTINQRGFLITGTADSTLMVWEYDNGHTRTETHKHTDTTQVEVSVDKTETQNETRVFITEADTVTNNKVLNSQLNKENRKLLLRLVREWFVQGDAPVSLEVFQHSSLTRPDGSDLHGPIIAVLSSEKDVVLWSMDGSMLGKLTPQADNPTTHVSSKVKNKSPNAVEWNVSVTPASQSAPAYGGENELKSLIEKVHDKNNNHLNSKSGEEIRQPHTTDQTTPATWFGSRLKRVASPPKFRKSVGRKRR